MGAIRKHQPEPEELDVERARAILAACTDLDEVKRIRDQAEAVARYQRSRMAAEDSVVHAAAIARRAERRLGELLAEMPKAEGSKNNGSFGGNASVPPAADAVTLRDLGITKNQSSAWQAIAAVPEDDFEGEIAESIEMHRIPSAAKFVRMGRSARTPQQPDIGRTEPEADSCPDWDDEARTGQNDTEDPDDCVPEGVPGASAKPLTIPADERPPAISRASTAESMLDVTRRCVLGLTDAERSELFTSLGVVSVDALSRLQLQRDADDEYHDWRQREANIKTKFGAAKPQLKIDFVLAGGEIALALLGLDYTVTPEKLSESYRSAALTAHPDRGGNATLMSALNQAHGIVRAFVEES